MMQPVLAISLGDPGGIGPEIVVKAFADSELLERCTPVLFGPADVAVKHMERFAPGHSLHTIQNGEFTQGVMNMVPLALPDDALTPGIASAANGAISLAAIAEAVAWCNDGRAAAIVTAPISKESIGMAGSLYKGHTEYIRDLVKGDDVLMVLASKSMKVGLVTVHIPIADIPSQLTQERIERTIQMAYRALKQDFGIADPRLAVLGLNPHAGDGGYLGSEEQQRIIPAIERLRETGMNIGGPFPADAFFSAHGHTEHDMIIAMYHDQGLIPLKMSAQGRAVNISCGLPIIRTSPDHGTAFNIAGKGIADPGSFIEAVHSALEIAEHRKSTTKEPQDD